MLTRIIPIPNTTNKTWIIKDGEAHALVLDTMKQQIPALPSHASYPCGPCLPHKPQPNYDCQYSPSVQFHRLKTSVLSIGKESKAVHNFSRENMSPLSFVAFWRIPLTMKTATVGLARWYLLTGYVSRKLSSIKKISYRAFQKEESLEIAYIHRSRFRET